MDVRSVPKGGVNGTGVYALELLRHLRGLDLSVLGELPGFPAVNGAPDVFHRPAQFNVPEHLEAFRASPAAKVLTSLDLIAYRSPGVFPDAEAHRRYRELQAAAVRAAAQVIAISAHARAELIDEFGLAPGRVHAIPLGVDAAFFSKPAPRPRAAPYFLCAGSDYHHKNLAALLRGYAWLRARTNGSVPELVLTGPSSGVSGGIFARGPELAAGVHYLGVVSRDALPGLYQHAVAFVYPSTYEGFGLPVLEAMAAGTPVVCSPLTSIPEVAGEAALYLRDFSVDDFARCLELVVADRALRDRLQAAGRERVRAFTWEETARRTAEVYALAASSHGNDLV